MTLTREQVQRLTGDADRWTDALNNALQRWNINTPDRVAMFLAQCAHESGGFKVLVESLRYSASRLLEVFPKYFTPAEAQRFAMDERAIAERVYGGRMGNAQEGLGDGYRFRGHGIIQLTGRDNYTRCGQAVGVDFAAHPEMLEQPLWAAVSAGWFWATNGCNELADRGDYLGVTKRINGGTNGLADREAWLATVRTILAPARPGGLPSPTPQQPAVAGQPNQQKENRMGALGAGLIGQLLQTVVGAFAPAARAKIEEAATKATDPDAGKALADGLMAILTKVTGQTDPIQATAAVTASNPQSQALLAKAQAESLDYLDKLSPLIDKMYAAEAARWKANDDSADRASARWANAKNDIAGALVKQSSHLFWAALIVIGVIAAVDLYKDGELDGGVYGLLSVLVYAIARMADRPSAHRFGGAYDTTESVQVTKSAVNQALDERRQGAKQ